jgi:hypothetical protein
VTVADTLSSPPIVRQSPGRVILRRGPAATMPITVASNTARMALGRPDGRSGSRAYTVRVRRNRIEAAGWRGIIAFDVLVPVVLGAALVIFLILIFASSSTSSHS